MAGNRYKFDLEDFTFRKVTISIREKLMKVLKFFIATSSLAVLYYMVAGGKGQDAFIRDEGT